MASIDMGGFKVINSLGLTWRRLQSCSTRYNTGGERGAILDCDLVF
ncbi:hypothetical protein HanPI659440_Chr11g0419171 [Helianthus annuus]|nr:hypothetical protein HanPI659440_Chr11g0419171 [Helianthus annuus]